MVDLNDMWEFGKRVTLLFTTIYLLISIIPLPMISCVVYFWGIPFVGAAGFFLFWLTKRIQLKHLNFSLALVIVLVLSAQWSFISLAHSNREHIGVENTNSQYPLSQNFMANATLNGKWEIIGSNSPVILGSKKNNMYSYFLIDWGPGAEEKIRNSDMKGSFFLFGEHDNLNGFIGNNSIFNNDNIQQKTPWNIYKPIMIRNLWVASVLDPFYCSNKGSTVSALPFLFPKIWTYDNFGVPKVLATTEIRKNKNITYFGDSDPAVSFLAPYNSSFLNALYKQPCKNEIIKIMILIAMFFSLKAVRAKRFFTVILCLGFGVFIALTFRNLQNNENIFDYAIDYRGKIESPHIENNAAYIVNSLSQNGNIVFLGNEAKNVKKAFIFVVPESTKIKIDPYESKGRKIIFLHENSSLDMEGRTYIAGSIPLGERQVAFGGLNIVVPDARVIEVQGIKKRSILKCGNKCFIIGTGSPQRFRAYEEIQKCWQ